MRPLKKRSVASNFSIQLVGRVTAVVIGMFSIAILTRALGTEGFGEYTTAMTFLQLFGVIVDFGLTLTLIVMISEDGADERNIVGNIFTMRLISGALVFSLAPISVLAMPWSSTVKLGVLIGALAYVFMGGAMLLVGIFQRYRAMWRVAIAEMLSRIVLFLLLGAFAILGFGVVPMIGTSIIANGVWLYLMIRFARPYVFISPRFDWSVWRNIIARSWPIAISIFFNLLYLKGDILFLAYFRDQTEVGLYGASYRIIDVLATLPVMAMGLLLPVLVNQWTSGDVHSFRKQVARTFDLFIMALIPILVGTQAVGEDLMTLIAGQGFEMSGRVLQLLILAVAGVFLGALFGHLVVALNKQKPMTWGYIGVAVVSIVGYMWLIPIYGMWGAVYVTLLSEGLIAMITYIVVRQVSQIRLSPKITLKAVASSALMYAVLITIPSMPVLVDLLIGAGVYMLAMLAIKAIRVEELGELIPRLDT